MQCRLPLSLYKVLLFLLSLSYPDPHWHTYLNRRSSINQCDTLCQLALAAPLPIPSHRYHRMRWMRVLQCHHRRRLSLSLSVQRIGSVFLALIILLINMLVPYICLLLVPSAASFDRGTMKSSVMCVCLLNPHHQNLSFFRPLLLCVLLLNCHYYTTSNFIVLFISYSFDHISFPFLLYNQSVWIQERRTNIIFVVVNNCHDKDTRNCVPAVN